MVFRGVYHMDIKRKDRWKDCICVLCFIILMVFNLRMVTCQKKFFAYRCRWVCEEPYICLENNNDVYMEIDGKIRKLIGAWKSDGSGIKVYGSIPEMGFYGKDDLIWAADCEVKFDRLIITVVEDNVSDCEGEKYILRQEKYETEELD